MTLFKKIFIFLLIIAFIGSAIYIYSSLKTTKAYTFTVPNINLQKINDKIKDVAKSTKSSITSFVEKKAENTVKENSKSFKQNTFNFIKENMNNGINAVGKAVGAEIQEKNSPVQQQNCQT